MNPSGSWWYIVVLWSETIGLCKKLNIIYNIITCNPEPQANGHSSELVHQIKLNRLKQFAAGAAQIYKLFNQTFQTPDSHSDSKWAKIAAYLMPRLMNGLTSY